MLLSWEDFDVWIEELVKELRLSQQAKNLKFVYGPPRGGLIPAVVLSHRLGLSWVSTYTELLDALAAAEASFNEVLWVDEIVETGKTLQQFLTRCAEIPNGKVRPGIPVHACWVTKLPSTKFPRLHSWTNITKTTWAIFPWEDPITWKRELEEYEARRQ